MAVGRLEYVGRYVCHVMLYRRRHRALVWAPFRELPAATMGRWDQLECVEQVPVRSHLHNEPQETYWMDSFKEMICSKLKDQLGLE